MTVAMRSSARGRRLRRVKGGLSAMDGPFTVSKELIGGYVIVELSTLLRNASEALPPEGGRIAFEAHILDGAARFVVADTGCGIPPELQGHVFERRFTHGKRGGTGLGLDQVRRIVERHRGHITLRSRPGQGTTFTVDIPLQPAEAARDLPLTERRIATGEAS